MYSFNLNRDVLDYVIEGFVAKQFFALELWADLFMTAVLSGEKFTVKSVKDRTFSNTGEIIDDPIGIFQTFVNPDPNAPIFECGKAAPCFERTVNGKIQRWQNLPQRYLPYSFP